MANKSVIKYLNKFSTKVLLAISRVIGFIGTYVVCVEKKSIVFSQANSRYSGNSRVLFEYLCVNGWNVKWFCQTIEQYERIPADYKTFAIKPGSIMGLMFLAKADIVVISHGSGDFGIFWHWVKHRLVLNVWHGIGIKNVGLLDNKLRGNNRRYYNRESKYYDIVTVSSDIFRYLFSVSHGLDVDKIFVTGDPRVDGYFKSFKNRGCSTFRVLYAPTFRDTDLSRNLFFPFEEFSKENLEHFLKKNTNVKFYLRPHPNDNVSNRFVRKYSEMFPDKLINYSNMVCSDIDSTIMNFDLIVSDFSSIHFEPLLTNTPCIFLPFDFKEYQEIRGLAFDYELVTPGPKVNNFDEFFREIEEAKVGAPKWADKRKFVRDMFFKYQDAKSCERIEKILAAL